MSKKIVFKGTPDGCFLPFEPDLLQLDLQEPNTTEPPSDSRTKQIEDLAKLSIKETRRKSCRKHHSQFTEVPK